MKGERNALSRQFYPVEEVVLKQMLQSIFGGSRKRFGLVAEKLLLSFSLWLIDCTFIKLLLKALLIFIITKPTSPQNYHIVSVTRRSGSDAGE